MKMSNYTWDYSTYADILEIHKKNTQTKGSTEIGDFTIDFDNNNELVGIAIEHASEFFKQLDITKTLLKEIQNAKILTDTRNPQCTLLFLALTFPNNIKKKISLPMPIAVSN